VVIIYCQLRLGTVGPDTPLPALIVLKQRPIRVFQAMVGGDLVAHFPAAKVEDHKEALFINKGFTQRIILIAANFRKEVTYTVLWLSNFKLRIQCFRVTAYSMGDQLFLNIEQIIPMKDAQDFMISIADKALDEVEGVNQEKDRHKVRREFWTEVLRAIAAKSSLFQNISPGKTSWIGASSGVAGVRFTFVAGKSYGRAELYIDRNEMEENKFIFDQPYAKRKSIETAFGGELTWERLDDARACRIKCETPGSIYDSDQWPTLIKFMTDAMVKMEDAFKEPLADIAAAPPRVRILASRSLRSSASISCRVSHSCSLMWRRITSSTRLRISLAGIASTSTHRSPCSRK
jgi:hypothetical protein